MISYNTDKKQKTHKRRQTKIPPSLPDLFKNKTKKPQMIQSPLTQLRLECQINFQLLLVALS